MMRKMVLRDRENMIRGLEPYLPPGTASLVTDMILSLPNLDVKVVEPRRSRRGDYVFKQPVGRHQITLNWNLSRHNFLITFLHEYAHLVVWNRYGGKVAPHGKEWKNVFREVAAPILALGILHPAFTAAFSQYLRNPYATSVRDEALMRACILADQALRV
ncbi:MAG: SprT-like domain-containing protein [Bacteroidales bacterium]